ncbi:MAG: helix-turn-helix domain-containing protein [Acidimicrobiales bacterium]
MSFGTTLRSWREERGFSQLRLASTAEVSQRHISFLENDRARPSREMVTHLGRVLRVPLREQNQLLLAAGFSPEFATTQIDDLGEVGRAIEFMLKAHEPNMAVVIDHMWNLRFLNEPAALLAGVLPDPPLFQGELNLMYSMFHPDGLGQFVRNRAEVDPMLLWRLADDVERRPTDTDLRQLSDAVAGLATASAAVTPAHEGLVGTVRFGLGDVEFAMFSCLTRLENSADLTLDGLRIETFFPADQQSLAAWTRFLNR